MLRSAISNLLTMTWAASLIALAGCAPPSPENTEPDSTITQEATSHTKHGPRHRGRSSAEARPSGRDQADPPTQPHARPEPKPPKGPVAGAPAHALKTLAYVEENGRAPEGYEGGRVFHNFGGGGEQALPRMDANGNAVTYHEWDVHAKRPGVNRGAERLVTGTDGSAYYTADHYRTFRKVR